MNRQAGRAVAGAAAGGCAYVPRTQLGFIPKLLCSLHHLECRGKGKQWYTPDAAEAAEDELLAAADAAAAALPATLAAIEAAAAADAAESDPANNTAFEYDEMWRHRIAEADSNPVIVIYGVNVVILRTYVGTCPVFRKPLKSTAKYTVIAIR